MTQNVSTHCLLALDALVATSSNVWPRRSKLWLRSIRPSYAALRRKLYWI